MMLALGMLAAALAVQDTAPPARPALPAGSDTNSAQAYYDFGVRQLRSAPAAAGAAFYWAERLNPEDASYPYARRVALLIDDPDLIWASRRRGDRAARARAADSLLVRALRLDPFLHRKLDDALLVELIAHIAGIPLHRGAYAREDDAELQRVLAGDPELGADLEYIHGRFASALGTWSRRAERNRRDPYIRADLGRVFALMGSWDSARVRFTQAIELARERDRDSIRFVYESKATWEYSLGRVLVQLGRPADARAAFERAVEEDLSYYPAHIQLGLLHVERGDTAAALVEFGRAMDGGEHEYLPHAAYAFFLAAAGRLDSAAVHLRRAIRLEPWAAAPRLNLGAILDARGDAAGAREAFEGYLARAARTDPDRATVESRLRELRGRN